MPKVLTEAQVQAFERDGCLSPVRVMSAERARHYRERFEALEARVPDIKKMKTKSHLLCPWVLEIAEDPHSILSKGQFIIDAFDSSKAVDFTLQPGEMVLFDNTLVHGSGTNSGPDRRFLLLVEMFPAWAKPPRVRQAGMLMRGIDTTGNFDDEPRPDAEWSETAVANWSAVVNRRAQLIFADSKVAPSEAYGGTRPAT